MKRIISLVVSCVLLVSYSVLADNGMPCTFYGHDGTYTMMSAKLVPDIKPRVSIITSVCECQDFIEPFLQDMLRQTIFDQCELIIIDAQEGYPAASLIQQYCTRYSNIVYMPVSNSLQAYALWNYGVQKARSSLLTHAHMQDRRNPESLEIQVKALEDDPTVDLVYANVYLSYVPNETFENNICYWVMNPQTFSPEAMYLCLPGPQAVWRASLHERYGLFDESFVVTADFEFWNRVVQAGARFKKISLLCGLYYQDPGDTGDSTRAAMHTQESQRIAKKYSALWRR